MNFRAVWINAPAPTRPGQKLPGTTAHCVSKELAEGWARATIAAYPDAVIDVYESREKLVMTITAPPAAEPEVKAQ